MSKQWQPVPDGKYEWENSVGDRDVYLRISRQGQKIEQWTDDEDGQEITLGSTSMRLCERYRQVEVADSAGVPDDVRHIILRWRNDFEQRAQLKLGTHVEFIGRMWLDEIAQIDTWLDSLAAKGDGGQDGDTT